MYIYIWICIRTRKCVYVYIHKKIYICIYIYTEFQWARNLKKRYDLNFIRNDDDERFRVKLQRKKNLSRLRHLRYIYLKWTRTTGSGSFSTPDVTKPSFDFVWPLPPARFEPFLSPVSTNRWTEASLSYIIYYGRFKRIYIVRANRKVSCNKTFKRERKMDIVRIYLWKDPAVVHF